MKPTAAPTPRPSGDQAPVADPVEQQGGDDGDHHAGGGDQVALLGGGRVGAAFDPDDEEREGDDVERRGGVAARLEDGLEDHEPPFFSASAFGFGFLENIPSIRSVTMKPPTMLIVPKAIAIVPITYSSGSLA